MTTGSAMPWLTTLAPLERVEILEDSIAELTAELLDEFQSMPYQEYLQTLHWQHTRRQALDRAGHACQLCNTPAPLEVHHRTYERRGREKPADLIVLCGSCHALFHGAIR